jgi:hypothetical protein
MEIITEDVVDKAQLHPFGNVDGDRRMHLTNATSLRNYAQDEDNTSSVMITTAQETSNSGTSGQVESVAGGDGSTYRASGRDRLSVSYSFMRRAGFGLLEETVPLNKRIQYRQRVTEKMV